MQISSAHLTLLCPFDFVLQVNLHGRSLQSCHIKYPFTNFSILLVWQKAMLWLIDYILGRSYPEGPWLGEGTLRTSFQQLDNVSASLVLASS